MDDNSNQAPKTFDIVPPSAQNSQAALTAPKVIIKKDPMLAPVANSDHTNTNLSPSSKEGPDSTLSATDNEQLLATPEKKIEPISQEMQAASLESKNSESNTQPGEQEALSDIPETVDAIPAPSQSDLAAKANSDNMQEPKIFDTKEYFVPINETKHSHGFVKGSIIAGVVASIIVLAIVAVLALQIK